MNYMKKVSEMLGLEWNDEKNESEVFKIEENGDDEYKICDTGIAYFSMLRNEWIIANSIILQNILTCKVKIKEKPWKPKVGDKYYCADITEKELSIKASWDNDNIDNQCYKNGLVFRTEEEAIAKAKEILKMLEVEQ